ncbi:MAG: autotransporter outer membrane beta-barrel domain-containing protein [Rhodospirillales bacterium]|nr:autotransporter outer membrane beta-barrel domain-containing protein [Rhodospirillales bacterium]
MLRPLLFAFLCLGVYFTSFNQAQAAAAVGTVNCTGITSEITTGIIYVHYYPSTNSCAVNNTGHSGETGSMFYQYVASSGRGTGLADNGLNGATSSSRHQGCTIGGETDAANTSCQNASIPNGSYTDTITALVTTDMRGVFTVNQTTVNGVSIDITSASVTITCTGVCTSPTSSTSSPTTAQQAAVSRSQSRVTITNVGSRLNSIGSPVGVSRGTPTGVGRETPTGVGRTVPGGGSTPTGSTGGTTGGTTSGDNNQSNFAGGNSSYNSYGGGLRELAMFASFDTSKMQMGAAANDNRNTDNLLSPQNRASASGEKPFTVWGYGSYTNVKNERNLTNDDVRFSGDVWGYNLGGDYKVNEQLYVGTSLGYSDTSLDTTYNTGTYQEDNWTLTPYAVYRVNEALKISALGGVSFGDIKQTRSSDKVNSKTDSTMWFAAMNVSYKHSPIKDMPLDVTAKTALLWTNKKVKGYTESDGTAIDRSTSNTRQIKPGLEAAYSHSFDDTTIQPFIKTDFVYDLKNATNGDANAFDLGGGVRIGSAATGLNGAIEGQTQLGRSDYNEYSFSALIAYGFALNSPVANLALNLEPYVKSDFSKNAQIYATGFMLSNKNNNLVATLDVTQTSPNSSSDNSHSMKMKIDIKF